MEFENCFFNTDDFVQTTKKLGEGAFGKVYVVESQNDDILYAAKIINTSGVLSSHDQMMLFRESFILHKLDHPAIVKFYGINFHSFDDPMTLMPTILTEYYPNGSLKEILDKEKNSIADTNWSPTKKYICLLGISDAMRYLHHAGIIHRDLKPQNILVDSNYYPRVCDFGLSRCFANSLTNSMKMSMTGKIGTPIYMAPELFEDEEKYGAAVDVYAFAILAYEIVTGKEPFSTNGKSANLKNFLSQILNGGRPEFTEGVQDNMKELITQCWSQNPDDRPSFESIFLKLSTDFSYSEETVDEDEINEYLEMLEDRRIEAEKKDKNSDIQSELEKLKDEINELKDDKKNLQIENEKLLIENKASKEKLSSNEIEIKNLQNEIDKLRAEIKQQSENSMKCLHVKICEARKILKKYSNQNIYISIRLRSQPKADEYLTNTIKNTNNAVWNEEFDLFSKQDDVLIINMYISNDSEKEEEIIDQLEFPVSEWPVESGLSRKEVEMKQKKKKIGTLVFEVQVFKPVGANSPDSIDPQKNKTRKYIKISQLKLTLVGNEKVGKSKLIKRIIQDSYEETYIQTIGASYDGYDFVIDGQNVKVAIWDCAGSERYKGLSVMYLRGADGVIVVYDVTKEETFNALSSWNNIIKNAESDKEIQIFLIGNKIDDVSNRKISYQKAHEFSLQHGWDYFEVSAKTGNGVNEAFQSIMTKIIQSKLDDLNK